MNVKKLKELLAEAPDDMEVMVMIQNHLQPGMFAFTPACECETGIASLGPDEEGVQREEQVFLVLPHGAGVGEGDEEESETVPELN